MKILFSIILSCYVSLASAQGKSKLILEKSTFVYFAPDAYRGEFKFQVYSDGTIQKVNNKKKKTVLATLSKSQLASLAKTSNAITNVTLSEPQGPECADAPLQKVSLFRNVTTTATEVVIWERVNCRESASVDENALKLVEFIENLQNAFQSIE